MSATVYWTVLGTLLGVGVCVIGITYIICRFRKPAHCWSDPVEEILQETETITESEIRSMRQNRDSRFPPTVIIRRESLKTISTRTSARTPRLTCVSCGSTRYHNSKTTDVKLGDHRDKTTSLWNTGSCNHDMIADVAV